MDINEAEELFLAIRHLLYAEAPKILHTVRNFINALFQMHPKLIEQYGHKCFKAIYKKNVNIEEKLIVRLYMEL